jgi:hypothetical protein
VRRIKAAKDNFILGEVDDVMQVCVVGGCPGGGVLLDLQHTDPWANAYPIAACRRQLHTWPFGWCDASRTRGTSIRGPGLFAAYTIMSNHTQ